MRLLNLVGEKKRGQRLFWLGQLMRRFCTAASLITVIAARQRRRVRFTA